MSLPPRQSPSGSGSSTSERSRRHSHPSERARDTISNIGKKKHKTIAEFLLRLPDDPRLVIRCFMFKFRRAQVAENIDA